MLAFLSVAFFLAALPLLSGAQSSLLVGTWSSGSGAVLTGPAFGNPVNNTFIYPAVAGWSFSFTEDGFFEQSQFTWVSNATDHHCIEAVIIWQHGTYTVNDNGTISTSSDVFAADGRIQTQNACSAVTSSIYYFNQANYFASWAISRWRAKDMLRLGQYDGALMPRMYRISDTPRDYMFDTVLLSNVTAA